MLQDGGPAEDVDPFGLEEVVVDGLVSGEGEEGFVIIDG